MNQMGQKTITVIIGLGATGLSCARFLSLQSVPFVMMDTRHNPPMLKQWQQEFPDQPLQLGGLDAEILSSAASLIVSPGISLQQAEITQAVAQGAVLRSDIDLLREATSAPFVCITGSNGKTTVTSLLGEMARDAGVDVVVAGNIGLPVLDAYLERKALGCDAQLYVLELSSFQLERSQNLHARAATVLNVTADHMDRYRDLEDYRAAKLKIYEGAQSCVVHTADALTRCEALPSDVKLIEVDCRQGGAGFESPYAVETTVFSLIEQHQEVYLAKNNEPFFVLSRLGIKGRHNQFNALVAYALGCEAGLDASSMCETLARFSGLPHRCEWLGEYGGVHYINDSKATNEGACIAAIEGLSDPSLAEKHLLLIAGGDAKGASFELLPEAVAAHVKQVILLGQSKIELNALLSPHVECTEVETLADAVEKAQSLALAGDTVLLSPACASLDMFDNFEHRGRVFTEAVRALVHESGIAGGANASC
jgi:UDP-N-acetylmuramoylalanine--D-glutamate ligase